MGARVSSYGLPLPFVSCDSAPRTEFLPLRRHRLPHAVTDAGSVTNVGGVVGIVRPACVDITAPPLRRSCNAGNDFGAIVGGGVDEI